MSRHFELRVLASFLVLAEELSFTRAAKRLHMTQPPLSLQIKQLEAELGVSLFDRTKRSVQLTPAGEAFRGEADKLFEIEHRAREIVRQVGLGEKVRHISIGFTPVTTQDLMPTLLRKFAEREPGIRFTLKELSSEAQRTALLNNELDLGFLRPPIIDQRLTARLLVSETHVLAVPVDHSFAQSKRVHVKQLHGEMLTILERRTGRYAHDRFVTWLSQSGVVPVHLHDVDQHHAVMALVSAGISLSLVPASAASQPVKGVVFKRLAGPPGPRTELCIAYRKDNINPMTLLFMELAFEHVSKRKAGLPQ